MLIPNAQSRHRDGFVLLFGAGNETRTRDLNLGKVALYQLSYSRINSKQTLCAEPLPHAFWRRGVESNHPGRICNPLHNRFATAPQARLCRNNSNSLALWTDGLITTTESGAGNETRTRDLNLGKVALYQLSYSRIVFAT